MSRENEKPEDISEMQETDEMLDDAGQEQYGYVEDFMDKWLDGKP
jgi:hypothetical protein